MKSFGPPIPWGRHCGYVQKAGEIADNDWEYLVKEIKKNYDAVLIRWVTQFFPPGRDLILYYMEKFYP